MNQVKGCRILLVYDDPQWGELFQLILNKRDDQVRFVPDGHQALTVAEQTPPDLIFIYLWTPGLNAFEFYSSFKAIPTLQSVPVVFCGGLNPETICPQIRPWGVAGYLCMPFAPSELIEARDTVLQGDTHYPHKPKNLKTLVLKFLGIYGYKARRAARRAFCAQYPQERVAWTSISAAERKRLVVGVFYGNTRPPGCKFYAVEKETHNITEIEDDTVYRPRV